jgi:hypothetical protein
VMSLLPAPLFNSLFRSYFGVPSGVFVLFPRVQMAAPCSGTWSRGDFFPFLRVFSLFRCCCGVSSSAFVFPHAPFWLASLLSIRTRQCPNHPPYVTTLPPVPGIFRGLFVPQRWDRWAVLKRQ